MITIQEIPIEKAEDFWNAHMKYLLEDEIISDEEDIEYFSGDEYRTVIIDHMEREPDKHHMVYFVRGNEKIGAAQYNTYQSEDGKCFILDFWVFPEYRGNGTGHACFEALERYTKADGALYYELNSEKEDSIRFWKSLGFEEAGVDEWDMKVFVKREEYTVWTIDQKYIELLKEYGIDLKIVHVNDINLPAQIILEKGNQVEIQLNGSKISEVEYETYLSYNVRKIVFPKLKLETARLEIRRFEIKDKDALFEFLSDRESCYLDGGYEPYTEKNDDYHDMMSNFAEEETRYVIVRKDTEDVIGMIHLMECNDRAVEVMEIGYTINPSQRRCGYATEAVKAMLRYLLQELHLDMVIAGALEDNKISLKMIENLGFVYEGRKRKALYHSINGPSDLLYFYMERV